MLTNDVIEIAELIADPWVAFARALKNPVRVLDADAPVGWLVSDKNMAAMAPPASPSTGIPGVPPGRYALYPGWHPGERFVRTAALWGIALSGEPTVEELAAFVGYWQAEGKLFHHVQWQQKLARSLMVTRSRPAPVPIRRDVNCISAPDNTTPDGFRG